MKPLLTTYARHWDQTASERRPVRLYHRAVLVMVAVIPVALVGIALAPAGPLLPAPIAMALVAVTTIPVALAGLAAVLLGLAAMTLAVCELVAARVKQGPPDIESLS